MNNAEKPQESILCGIRGEGRKKLVKALQDVVPFHTSGSLRGDFWNEETCTLNQLGRLPAQWSNRFMIDHINGIKFVVWSYETPIAWVCNDGTICNVEYGFSTTTSKHQGFTRAYLGKHLLVFK